MTQKKLLDLLFIASDLLDQWQKLGDQSQSQARFRSCRDGISSQTGLVQLLEDLGSHFVGGGVTGRLKEPFDLLHARHLRGLQSRVGLQKHQGRTLLQFGKEIQGDRVVRFEAGGELVDQARLHLDQTVLIACQPLEFGYLLAIGYESVQIRQVRSARFGKQIGINDIRLGTRCRTLAINGAWIDGIDRPAMLQQPTNCATRLLLS